MKEDKKIDQSIFRLQGKIEKAENNSSGSVKDESRLDDLHCELFSFEEMFT
jgi:predicted  nucleic acid-binding Zn-ribbon protein